MKLMIIESPGKIKKLTAILGDGWKIAASVGHIRDLPRNEMGVSAPNFAPQYEYIPSQPIPGQPGKSYPSSKERIDGLKQLAKGAEAIYLATDPDREGESISWHLKECLGLSNPKRVTFGEITATAVNAGLKAHRTIDMNLVAAQEARRVLDRLVGYLVSPVLSQQTGQKLSAGRVQSPAVRLVVERERQIKAFRPTNHFGAKLYFGEQESEWFAEWLIKPEFVTDDSPFFMDKAFATAVTKVKAVVVKTFEEHEARRSPPPPFNTSLMLQAASVALSLDPKAAMHAAQKLNEQGHITYHRTDNPNVSEESLKDIRAEAAKLGLDMVEKQRKFPCPEGAQVGHPAITPTHWDVVDAGETSDQRALYKLIRLRAIACQLADARYKVRTARLTATELVQGKHIEFEGKGRTLIYSGWLKLIENDQTEEGGEKEAPNPVPVIEQGQTLNVEHGELLSKKTKAPGRYTQASLVKKLETEGIGRPATYAAIMDNIVSRAYVKTVKKFLEPTPSGELIVDSLVDKFKFIDLGFTRDVEKELDLVAAGKAGFKDVIQKVYDQLQNELAKLDIQGAPATTTIKAKCPKCKNEVTSDARTLSCKCGFKLWREIAGLRLTDAQCESLLATGSIQNTPGFKSGKTGKLFSAGLKLAADLSGKVDFVFEERAASAESAGQDKAPAKDAPACPKCKNPMRKRTGARGAFWGCSGYPDCKVTAADNQGKMGKVTGYT
ncbi:MAG: type I DNA topoisomerase [Sideroxydans sp.]|nr:type I DNA topoisomerase [Sideroxydans sp.]MDD5056661.1 type I DNA topoisomerase [Sideroxydans sp.]